MTARATSELSRPFPSCERSVQPNSGPWDVLVIGAGSAGLLAAIAAASAGARVLLVDRERFPRTKVCGGCVNRAALATLGQFDLENLPEQLGGVGLHAFDLAAGGRRARMRLPSGWAISRRTLDAGLVVEASHRGAIFADGWRARIVRPGQAELTATGTSNAAEIDSPPASRTVETVEAAVIVAADGLQGGALPEPADVRSGGRVGLGALVSAEGTGYPPGVIHMACGRDGYVGLTRVEGGMLNVAAAIDPQAIKAFGGPQSIVERIIDEAGLPRTLGLDGQTPLRWRGVPPMSRRRRKLWSERLLIVGDAAGYVEPFTGEGMAWAMAGGAIVGKLAAEAGRVGWSDALGQTWQRLHARNIGRRQLGCRLVAWALRRPMFVRRATGLLSAGPLARLAIDRLNRPVHTAVPTSLASSSEGFTG